MSSKHTTNAAQTAPNPTSIASASVSNQPATHVEGSQPLATQEPTGDTGTDLLVIDFGEDAGAGLQNVTMDERSIPFIKILQSTSPECDKSKPSAKLIKEAQSSQLFKTSTRELFDGEVGMDFIPVHRDCNFVEAQPLVAGGGFVGIRPANDPEVLALRAKAGKFKVLISSTGTELVETYYIYGYFLASPTYKFPALLRFKSTQIPYYKSFVDTCLSIEYPNSKGGTSNPPLFAHRWHLSSMPDSNKKGSYFSHRLAMVNGATALNPRPALVRQDNPLYALCKEFYASIQKGHVQANFKDADDAGGEGASAGHDTQRADDDIPF